MILLLSQPRLSDSVRLTATLSPRRAMRRYGLALAQTAPITERLCRGASSINCGILNQSYALGRRSGRGLSDGMRSASDLNENLRMRLWPDGVGQSGQCAMSNGNSALLRM